MKTSEEKTQTEQIFSLFVGDHELRPIMLKPFEINGKTYATDSIAMIRTDNSNIDFVVENGFIKGVDGVFREHNCDYTVDLSGIDFEKYRTEDILEEDGIPETCTTCKGSGEVEWSFEHHTKNFDCPDCDGMGGIVPDDVPTGEKTFPLAHVVKIKDAYVRMSLVYKLFEVQKIVGRDILFKRYEHIHEALLFTIGSFEILLMPMMFLDANDTECHHVHEVKLLETVFTIK